MVDLNENILAKLAYEMALNIRSYKVIFADFGITEEDYYEICKLEYFKKAKEAYTLQWNSVESTADRVKIQGQAGTEVLYPHVLKRAMRADESLANAIEALKMSAKIGGLGEAKPDAKAASERFVITINLGGDTEHYNKSIEINPNDINLGENNGQIVEQGPSEPAVKLLRPAGEGQGA